MRCYYINLTDSQTRREFIEANFAQVRLPHWQLTRIEAVSAQEARQIAPHCAHPAQLACALSHRRAWLQAQADGAGHALILEDDALLGQSSCVQIERTLHHFDNHKPQWQLLFPDACITDPAKMIHLLLERRKLVANNDLLYFDAAHSYSGSTTAYIVNQAAWAALDPLPKLCFELDAPIDLIFRQQMEQKKLSAWIVFPFLTSLSAFADATTILSETSSKAANDAIHNALRRLLWLERDIPTALTALQQLPPEFHEAESQAMAQILAARLAPAYPIF